LSHDDGHVGYVLAVGRDRHRRVDEVALCWSKSRTIGPRPARSVHQQVITRWNERNREVSRRLHSPSRWKQEGTAANGHETYSSARDWLSCCVSDATRNRRHGSRQKTEVHLCDLLAFADDDSLGGGLQWRARVIHGHILHPP